MVLSGDSKKQVKINEATVTLRSDDIIHVLFHKKVLLDLPLQMLLLNIYNEVADGKKYPFLFEAMAGMKVTREARENAIRIEDQSPGLAYAVLAPTLVYQMIANFYVSAKKPKAPYRVFRDKDKAIEWLRTFL